MSVSPEFKSFVAELLAPLGRVSIRDMFGGAGVFYDGLMFALIIGETIYVKTDPETRDAYVDAGSEPFSYDTSVGRRALTNYMELPEHLLDEAEELLEWMQRAVQVALRGRRKVSSARARVPARGGVRRRARR